MAKRQDKGEKEPAIELSEHLVRKALNINPDLRDDGKSTLEVLDSLKEQVVRPTVAPGGRTRGSTPI